MGSECRPPQVALHRARRTRHVHDVDRGIGGGPALRTENDERTPQGTDQLVHERDGGQLISGSAEGSVSAGRRRTDYADIHDDGKIRQHRLAAEQLHKPAPLAWGQRRDSADVKESWPKPGRDASGCRDRPSTTVGWADKVQRGPPIADIRQTPGDRLGRAIEEPARRGACDEARDRLEDSGQSLVEAVQTPEMICDPGIDGDTSKADRGRWVVVLVDETERTEGPPG